MTHSRTGGSGSMDGGQASVGVNTADAAALDTVDGLNGHGFEIVRYREKCGRFTALRRLDEVPGLAGKTDAATLARLTVSN